MHVQHLLVYVGIIIIVTPHHDVGQFERVGSVSTAHTIFSTHHHLLDTATLLLELLGEGELLLLAHHY